MTEVVGNCSSKFYANDALLPAELVSVEFSDYDIHSLLCENEAFPIKHTNVKSFENIGKSTSSVLSEGGYIDSVNSNVNSNTTSLGALAEKHLKNDRSLYELSDDCAFDFSNLLDDNLSVKTEKSISHEHLNLLDLNFAVEENLPNSKYTSESNDDTLLNDLSDLLNLTQESNAQPPVSLDSFSSKNLKNESIKFSPLCLEDITELSSGDVYSNSSSYSSSEISNGKSSFGKEIPSDDELIPDIDLSFCIKKHTKDASSNSSEDSGFDESSVLPLELSSLPLEKNDENALFSMHRECSPHTREIFKVSKQSLFSKAISAKPKMNEAAREKLKKVRSELIQKSCLFNLIGCTRKENSHPPVKVVDLSNECVVMSSFLKIPDKNSSFCHIE